MPKEIALEQAVVKGTAGPHQTPVLPAASQTDTGYAVSENRLFIPKIRLNAPIVEGLDGNAAMDRGAWLMPQGVRPDAVSGNIVISGHRFKYLPPNNITFYLFHKLEPGDGVKLVWDGIDYDYIIREKKIVEKTDLSILRPSDEKRLTLFTCEPIFSQEKRLVLVAEPED